MYKIAFCYIWDEHQDPKPIFSRLRQLGYEGIELWDQTVRQHDIAYWQDTFAGADIACAQLCPYFNFVDGQEFWDETMRIAEQYINWATKLGNPLIRVFTGKPWGEGVIGPDLATPAQWDAAICGLQRVCDMAAPYGIKFALECHTGSLMEDSPSALRLLQGVDRANLGVNLQLPLKDGHEAVEASLSMLGKYTWHMHTHNYTQLIDGQLTYLSDGVIDYSRIFTELLAYGFSGYSSIEHATCHANLTPWEVAEHEAIYLNELRQKLTIASV